MAARQIYSNRIVAAVLIPFSVIIIGLALLLPFLLKSPILGFFLMSLPALFGGVIMLLHGLGAGLTRIEIAENGLELALPVWRGFPTPPVRRAALAWIEVIAVRRRIEIYHWAFPFPVWVFAIDTSQGRFVLGGKIGWLPRAMEEIARHSNCPVEDLGEVEAGMVSALKGDTPEWPPVSSARTFKGGAETVK